MNALALLVAWAVLTGGAPPGQSDVEPAMAAEIVKTGSLIVRGIAFEPGGATLLPASRPSLQELRRLLTKHTEWIFEVQGHTNEAATPAGNEALSAARARAVVSWLTANGIPAPRLTARGYGDTRPLKGDLGADEGLRCCRIELRKVNEE